MEATKINKEDKGKEIAKLVSRMQHGDMEAFEDLYNETYRPVCVWINSAAGKILLSTPSDQDDIVQLVYMKVINKIQDIKNPEAFLGWLRNTAITTTIDFYKYNKTYNETYFYKTGNDSSQDEDMANSFIDLVEEGSVDRDTFNPEEKVDYAATKEIVMDMIDNLSEDQRKVILLHYFSDLTTKKIAEMLECAEGTVKRRLFDARANLKKQAEAWEKRGVVLHGVDVALFPFLRWMFSQMEEEAMQQAGSAPGKLFTDICAKAGIKGATDTAAAVAGEVAGATGEVGTSAVGATGGAGTSAGAITSAGGKLFSIKLIAGIAAAAAVGGAAIWGVTSSSNEDMIMTVEATEGSTEIFVMETEIGTIEETEPGIDLEQYRWMLEEIADLCVAGEYEAIWEMTYTQDFIDFYTDLAEYGEPYIIDKGEKAVGFYGNLDMGYYERAYRSSNCMIYYGEYRDGLREGNGVWIGSFSDASKRWYVATGEWGNDAPNGYQSTTYIVGTLDSEGVETIQCEGYAVDGIWEGEVQESFLPPDESYISFMHYTCNSGYVEFDKIRYDESLEIYFYHVAYVEYTYPDMQFKGTGSNGTNEGHALETFGIPGFSYSGSILY